MDANGLGRCWVAFAEIDIITEKVAAFVAGEAGFFDGHTVSYDSAQKRSRPPRDGYRVAGCPMSLMKISALPTPSRRLWD